MAWVYRAYHPQLDRYVAVKLLRSDLVDDEEFLARFQREARAVANLRHPHIIQVFDFDVEDGAYYMVMEYLEGDTLKARLSDYRTRGEQMPFGEIVRIMLDVLDGLAYAHAEGMVHRDIKPSNILLTKRGQAVLGDFGIALMVGGAKYTATGALMGTPEYMSPEQGLHGHSDTRSDIYSMGVILFEMLTQRVPFEAETPLAVLMKHINDPLSPPREINPKIPISLERIVLKAMAKAPQDRYADAGSMAAALQGAVDEAAIGLPERVSLPLSFRTVEAPLESVVVVSRAAERERVDSGVAEAETNITLPRVPVLSLSDEVGENDGPHANHRGQAANAPQTARSHLTRGIFMAIGIVSLGNLFGITVSSLLRNWAIFQKGWPMELLLVGGALFLLMAVSQSIWLSIPAAVVAVNGFLFTYTAFSGNWHHWAFLWIVEVWIVAATVITSSLLAQSPPNARRISHVIGWATGAAILIASVAVQGAALAIDFLSRFIGWLH